MQSQRRNQKKQVTVTTTVVKAGPKGSNNQQARKRKQRNRRRNAQNQAVSNGTYNTRSVMVLPCTVGYAKALADPWGALKHSGDVCIPDTQSVPSFKFNIRMRGTMTVGSNGFGFIVFNPYVASANDIECCKYSNSTFSGVSIPSPENVSGCNVFQSNSIMDSNVRTRLVASGLRVRYSGTELNRGGSAIPFRANSGNPDTNDSGDEDFLPTDSNMGYVANLNRSDIHPINRQFIGTVYTPPDAQSRGYTLPSASYRPSYSDRGNIMGILVRGQPNNTFDFDIACYYEAISSTTSSIGGAGSVPSTTRSHSDPDGYGFVQDTYAKLADSDFGQAVWRIMKKSAATYVSSHIPFASSAALPWVEEL